MCFSNAFFAYCEIVESNRLFSQMLDACVPSPLAGEGQGEGEPITCERSEHLNSIGKTAVGYCLAG
jgi:hypothetical protein